MFENKERIRVHIENRSTSPSVYLATPERVKAACARHPAVAEHLQITIGEDLREFDDAIKSADALIGFFFPTDNFSDRAPNLRLVHLIGAGADHLAPFNWIPSDLKLTTSSGVHSRIARDYAMMALLMLNHRIPYFTSAKIAKIYDRRFPTGTWKKTVVIIGVGQMGAAAAKGAKLLGMRVLGIRRSAQPHPDVDEMFETKDLHAILPRADFVLITTPLTRETNGLIGHAELDLMRPHAGLINMGRAGIVDNEALARKLRKGELGGAVIDVFRPEPLPRDSFLWDVPNLIMTPHVSSDEEEDYIPGCLDVFFENIARLRAGQALLNEFDTLREY
jgi:phosphoglycerate dehydrogenase-like enzyme